MFRIYSFTRSQQGRYRNELLDILTKFSPNSLTKIFISADWEYSIDALERFFENCRERTLHQFEFIYTSRLSYYYIGIAEEHKEIIKKYISIDKE